MYIATCIDVLNPCATTDVPTDVRYAAPVATLFKVLTADIDLRSGIPSDIMGVNNLDVLPFVSLISFEDMLSTSEFGTGAECLRLTTSRSASVLQI